MSCCFCCFREQTLASNATAKPEMLEKIIGGKVNKRISEICLTSQPHFVEEGSPAVSKFMSSVAAKLKLKDIGVTAFSRWTLGAVKDS